MHTATRITLIFIKQNFYLIYIKIIVIYWAYKLRLKYRDLKGVWLALEEMSKKNNKL